MCTDIVIFIIHIERFFIQQMRGELNTHYLIHTDAKNFICVICGLGFRTKMAMDSHTLRKHTNLKPSIPCEECGKLFRVRSGKDNLILGQQVQTLIKSRLFSLGNHHIH